MPATRTRTCNFPLVACSGGRPRTGWHAGHRLRRWRQRQQQQFQLQCPEYASYRHLFCLSNRDFSAKLHLNGGRPRIQWGWLRYCDGDGRDRRGEPLGATDADGQLALAAKGQRIEIDVAARKNNPNLLAFRVNLPEERRRSRHGP